MTTIVLVLLLNIATGLCGVLSWQAASGTWAAIWGMLLALGLFAEWAWWLAPKEATPEPRPELSRPAVVRGFRRAKGRM